MKLRSQFYNGLSANAFINYEAIQVTKSAELGL